MLLEFHESYRKVNWDSLIQQAGHTLTIVVYYWDKWVKEHEKSLQQFLKKPNAKIHFFFSDNLAEVQKLFPNNTREQLEEKIRLTCQLFLTISLLIRIKNKIYINRKIASSST